MVIGEAAEAGFAASVSLLPFRIVVGGDAAVWCAVLSMRLRDDGECRRDSCADDCGFQHLRPLSSQLDVKRRAVIAVARNLGVEGAHKPVAAHKPPTHKTPVAVAVYIQARIVGLPAT